MSLEEEDREDVQSGKQIKDLKFKLIKHSQKYIHMESVKLLSSLLHTHSITSCMSLMIALFKKNIYNSRNV